MDTHWSLKAYIVWIWLSLVTVYTFVIVDVQNAYTYTEVINIYIHRAKYNLSLSGTLIELNSPAHHIISLLDASE